MQKQKQSEEPLRWPTELQLKWQWSRISISLTSHWSSPQAVEYSAISDYFVYFLDARITTRSFPGRFGFVSLWITSTSIFVLSNEGIYIIFVLLNLCTHTANTFKLHSSRNPVYPVTSITSNNSKSFLSDPIAHVGTTTVQNTSQHLHKTLAIFIGLSEA